VKKWKKGARCSGDTESSFGDKEIHSQIGRKKQRQQLGKKMEGKTCKVKREERDGSQSWCGVGRKNRKMIKRKTLSRH